MFKEQGLNAVILKNPIDQPFISRLEEAMKDKNVKFRRIDTDLADVFKEMRFKVIALPEFNEGDTYRSTARFQRVIGANDSLT